MLTKRFESQRVIVTGAAHNTGIAIARKFAQEGARVIMADVAGDALASAAQSLREQTAGDITDLVCDISQPSQIQQFFSTVANRFGGLDVLVNNAAHQGIGYTVEQMPLELLNQVLDINIRGTFLCAQHAAQIMIPARSGAIINLSSNVSARAIYKRSAYVTSKGAIDAMTRALAIELAAHGIRVNAVAPGYIHSDRWSKLTPEHIERRRQNIPSHKESMPEEIADVILYLASQEAKAIIGARIVVDGGCSAQHMPADVDM